MFDVLDLRDLLRYEIAEQRESGHDVADLSGPVTAALADADEGGGAGEAELRALLDAVRAAPRRAGWPYHEPSTWPRIVELLPPPPPLPGAPAQEGLSDRLHGGWLGRCAGCTLGKPVEGWGWTRERIRAYLTEAGGWPLRDYVPALDPMPSRWTLHPDCWRQATRGNVAGVPRDDDVDYTIVALLVAERYGVGFGPADVGAVWLDTLPFTRTYTAERAAYRNLVCGVRPPRTATVDNPYREWIGAQIRGDLWGWINPGDPRAAARLAFTDASLSHVANGVYGEMWVAALLALALVTDDVHVALRRSLDHVPATSRLAEALRRVLTLHADGVSWDAARDDAEERLGHYNWVHTIPNAAVVALALAYGDGDVSRTLGLAVEGGWDTDCNGATAGSVVGTLRGAAALPAHWVRPLEDRVASAVSGEDGARISDLAARTLRLARVRSEAR